MSGLATLLFFLIPVAGVVVVAVAMAPAARPPEPAKQPDPSRYGTPYVVDLFAVLALLIIILAAQ